MLDGHIIIAYIYDIQIQEKEKIQEYGELY